MGTNRRYYWLKLKDDFFSSKRIKKLRKMAGGDTYVIIYLKLQLLAMKTEGILEWTHLENDVAEELALDLDEEPDDVRVTLMYLLQCGLAETSDNEVFYFPYAIENTGSETASTQRSRDLRARKKLEENAKALQCNANATQLQRECNGEIEIEKEKEIEKELETDTEIEIESKTVPNGTVCRTKDVRRVIEAWNSLGLNQIVKILPTSNRGNMLRARINEYGIDAVIGAIENIRSSGFLQGQNSRGWTITFDWFVRPNNFPKVLEGNYDNLEPMSKGKSNNALMDLMNEYAVEEAMNGE